MKKNGRGKKLVKFEFNYNAAESRGRVIEIEEGGGHLRLTPSHLLKSDFFPRNSAIETPLNIKIVPDHPILKGEKGRVEVIRNPNRYEPIWDDDWSSITNLIPRQTRVHPVTELGTNLPRTGQRKEGKEEEDDSE